MSETIDSWDSFVLASRETAYYPDAGKSTPLELCYLSLGLIGEVGELFVPETPEEKKDLLMEIGDCFWYLAGLEYSFGKETGISFSSFDGMRPTDVSKSFQEALSIIKTEVLLVANYAKKVLRDEGVSPKKTMLQAKIVAHRLKTMLMTLHYVEGYDRVTEAQIYNNVMNKLRERVKK